LEDFFVWFARNGATQCKKKGGWLSPMGKIESTLHEIVNRPVSYDKVSSERIEILPEFHASLGNILAKRFLKILSSQIRFKALNQ
jgi:hypothetical protein